MALLVCLCGVRSIFAGGVQEFQVLARKQKKIKRNGVLLFLLCVCSLMMENARWVVPLLIVLASACLCCGSLWPWSSSEGQVPVGHQQHDDVLDAARDKIYACLESWTERDTEYLASECFDQDRFEMKEPMPIPSMDAEEYLEALDQLLPAMPNARSTLGPVVLVDYDGARLEGAAEGQLKFAYRWRFNGTFLPKVNWLGWEGQGQEVAYDAFSVGTATWQLEDEGIRVRMTEIRNYYSVIEVMLLFALPEEMDPRRLGRDNADVQERRTAILDPSQVEGPLTLTTAHAHAPLPCAPFSPRYGCGHRSVRSNQRGAHGGWKWPRSSIRTKRRTVASLPHQPGGSWH